MRPTPIRSRRRSISDRGARWAALALACALLGATATGTLTPSATVIATCTISGATLAFGAYDPVVANRSSDLVVAPNALSISCTRGAPSVTVALDLGLNATGTTRRMISGADFLTTEIYTNAGHGTVWNAANTVSYTSTTMAATPMTVYGVVPSGQDAAIGASYTDTITATVNF